MYGVLPRLFYSFHGVRVVVYRSAHRVFYAGGALFAALFIFISGICSTFSASNLKNGLKLAAVAVGISAVTLVGEQITDMNMGIYFGVIHLLAVCLLLAGVLDGLRYKYPLPVLQFILLIPVFLISYDLVFGQPFLPWLGLSELGIKMPYGFHGHPWLMLFGFPEPGWPAMADYFPITPWIFMFFMGACFARFRSKGVLPRVFKAKGLGFLRFLGKHSLLIYIIHQPVIFGMCYLIQFICGGAV